MKNRKHDIEKYLRGELSAAEMHALERAALNDPFLAEALEGVEHAGGADNFLHDLHKLNKSVHQRSHKRKHKTLQIWGWTTAAAATLLLVLISGFMVITLLREQRRELQAQRAEERLLLEMTSSRDTLTVVLPPRIAYHESGTVEPPSREQSTSGQRREAPSVQRAPDRAQGDQQQSDEIQTAPEEAADTKAQLRENQDAEREPIALADVPETITPEEKPEEEEPEEISKRYSKKAESPVVAGQVRSETPSPSRAAQVETAARVLRGKVTSSTDGDGLPGVNVVVKGSGVGTITDVDGNYEIIVSEKDPTLVFSFIGFQRHEVRATGHQEVNVSLEEDVASLSEVVVTGFGVESGKAISGPYRSPEPSGGRSSFKDYLSKAVRYPAEAIQNKTEGRVTVRFSVEPDGKLTNFEVIKGIGSGCDEELIRAIQQGPSWQSARRGEEVLREEVKVRFVFRLP